VYEYLYLYFVSKKIYLHEFSRYFSIVIAILLSQKPKSVFSNSEKKIFPRGPPVRVLPSAAAPGPRASPRHHLLTTPIAPGPVLPMPPTVPQSGTKPPDVVPSGLACPRLLATGAHPCHFECAVPQTSIKPRPESSSPPFPRAPPSRPIAGGLAPSSAGHAQSRCLPSSLYRSELTAFFAEPEPRHNRLPVVASAGVDLLALPCLLPCHLAGAIAPPRTEDLSPCRRRSLL
jgi:hypothetical protein